MKKEAAKHEDFKSEKSDTKRKTHAMSRGKEGHREDCFHYVVDVKSINNNKNHRFALHYHPFQEHIPFSPCCFGALQLVQSSFFYAHPCDLAHAG